MTAPTTRPASPVADATSLAGSSFRRTRRGGWSIPAALILAIILIALGDRSLRRRQDLVGIITSRDSPVMIPFSDLLHDKAALKAQYNDLVALREAAVARGDRQRFTNLTFDLAVFIASHVSPTDERRRLALADLVARYGDHPDSIPAYFELFNPAWKASMEASYPRYTEKVLQASAAQPNHGLDYLLQLAGLLHEVGVRDLELKVVRQVWATQRVGRNTFGALQQFLQLADASDPDRPKVQAAFDAYQRRRDAALVSAKWFATFAATRPKATLAELEQARRGAPAGSPEAPAGAPGAPAGSTDGFTAAADAILVDEYLKAGRFADAARIRASLLSYDFADIDDCAQAAMELAGRFDPPMNASPQPHEASSGPAPDEGRIREQQWRAMLRAGRTADAARTADALFGHDVKGMRALANDAAAAERLDFTKLTPNVAFAQRAENAPPELAGASVVYAATLDLRPVGKAVPADIHTKVELWCSADLVVALFTADEPRTPTPKATVTQQDGDVFRDECVEICFNPDAWFDFYYQIVVNSAGVVWDARLDNQGGNQLQFKADPKVNLGVKTVHAKTAGGWSVRLVLPRKLVIPPGPAVIRLNARRLRYVDENKHRVQQVYSWGPVTGPNQQPDRFGWAYVPK